MLWDRDVVVDHLSIFRVALWDVFSREVESLRRGGGGGGGGGVRRRDRACRPTVSADRAGEQRQTEGGRRPLNQTTHCAAGRRTQAETDRRQRLSQRRVPDISDSDILLESFVTAALYSGALIFGKSGREWDGKCAARNAENRCAVCGIVCPA